MSNEFARTRTCCRPCSPRPASPTSSRRSRRGTRSADKKFKVHLDGYNLLPYLEGEEDESPRPGFLYWSDDGDLLALRYGQLEVQLLGAACRRDKVWEEPFVRTRVPNFYNLRNNPFELDNEVASIFFYKEKFDRAFLILPAVGLVSQYLKTFEEFPPRQRPASFSIDQAVEKAREKEQQMHEAGTRG